MLMAYTQRHNRLKQTDGPLFRGRFKAILVDKDAYLLQLSRYIHRNPIDRQSPLVADLVNYRWSSYPAYLAKAKVPAWLHRETTYRMLGNKQRYKGYATYIMEGVDDDTMHYYQRSNLAAIIGDRDFKTWVYNTLLPKLNAEEKSRVVQPNITMKAIVEGVASIYGTTPDELRTVIKGPKKGNDARKIAMYLCQELASVKLKYIAVHFNLRHVGSVSFITHQVRKMKREGKVFARQIDEAVMSIMKNAT